MKRAGSPGRPRLIVLLGVVALLAPAIVLPYTESRTYYRPAGASSIDFIRVDPPVPYYVETQTRYYSVFYFPHELVDIDQSGIVKIITDYSVDRVGLVLEWVLIVLVTIGLVIALRLKDQLAFRQRR